MSSTTDRLALPLLASGQAQKEFTHNAALALADMLIMPTVQAVALTTPPAAPVVGQCWIIGTGATGVWAGHDNTLACFTAGGWLFVPPQDGMQVWSLADHVMVLHNNGVWTIGTLYAKSLDVAGIQVVGAQQLTIASPTGGTVIDDVARTAISAILAALKTHGLIAAA
ncbi:MAG: DUF2793 domain-containing protein [Alphaproteobacteria bacterium]|nr:DUF2793 domain-containing protein [Alphaproteobacteria bacterium]MDE2339955.1 DUF2793 domain-containing protein [Alphaproteobacteria bacterium]